MIYLSKKLARQVAIHRNAVELMDAIKNDESIPYRNDITFADALKLIDSESLNRIANSCDKLNVNRVQDEY